MSHLNTIPNRVLDAWSATGISKFYDWSKAARGIQPHSDLANLANQPMCDAYRIVRDLSGGLDSLFFQRKKAKTSEATAEIDTRIAETRRAIVSATAAAMETIKEKAALIPEILATHAPRPAPPAEAIDDSPSP